MMEYLSHLGDGADESVLEPGAAGRQTIDGGCGSLLDPVPGGPADVVKHLGRFSHFFYFFSAADCIFLMADSGMGSTAMTKW